MKNKFFKTFSLSLILSLSVAQFAFAAKGADSSGGGNAIVCFDNSTIISQIKVNNSNGGGHIPDSAISHITSVELLDIHKAKLPFYDVDGERKISQLIDSKEGETQTEFRERILMRFSKLVPELNIQLTEGKKRIVSVKEFPQGISTIDDVNSGEVVNSNNCVRSTIIAQYDEEGATYIALDSRIFSLSFSIFPVRDRVLSLWHEYFYKLARDNGAISSDAVQSLVGNLIKEKITGRDVLKFMDVILKTKTEYNIMSFVQKSLNQLINYTTNLYDHEGLKKKCLVSSSLFSSCPYKSGEKFYRFEEMESLFKNKLNQRMNDQILTKKVLEKYKLEILPELLSISFLPTDIAIELDQKLENWIINNTEVKYTCDIRELDNGIGNYEFYCDVYGKINNTDKFNFDFIRKIDIRDRILPF